jgi:serine/threonine-protein kinase
VDGDPAEGSRHDQGEPGAGFVHLFSLASEAYQHKGFLETAEGAGWDVWGSRFFSGHHLCCGLAGRAYALLNLHRSTGDPAWLDKAGTLADRAVAHILETGDTESPNSLYRGRLGVAVLVAELEQPEEATMPFFEPEDWAS